MKLRKQLDGSGLDVFCWIEEDEIEDSAWDQVKDLAYLPFAKERIVVLPDIHAGFGMPIGTAIATSNEIVVNAVGCDIGCGVLCVKTSIKADLLSRDLLKSVVTKIKDKIPVGFNQYTISQPMSMMPVYDKGNYQVVPGQYDKALHQLGTLGGGNHFIELQKNKDGFLCLMIHSGSRNLGKQVADHYYDKALDLNKKWFSNIKQDLLAFLPADSDDGEDYLREMQYCVDYAIANRRIMASKIISILKKSITGLKDTEWIDVKHNFVRKEHHFGKDLFIHRKGCVSADKDEMVIIPGSQGTRSYIAKGLGNILSFKTCSHGSGRKMGRNEAKRTLDMKEEIIKLLKAGVIHSVNSRDKLDEAPGAYKDINDVMENQLDLVMIEDEMQPLAVIKG